MSFESLINIHKQLDNNKITNNLKQFTNVDIRTNPNLKKQNERTTQVPFYKNIHFHILGISLILVLLFAYTAANKLYNHDRFVFQLQLVPVHLVQISAAYLSFTAPVAELALAIALCIKRYHFIALASSLALLLLFEIYLSVLVLTNKILPCSCAGVIPNLSWDEQIIFNAFLICITCYGVLIAKKTNYKIK
jgi:uncharacterized membrane protein YhaH (DUF805 family)